MKTRVYIPFTNEKVFTGRSRRKERFQPEFREWITNTFGQVAGGYWGTASATNGVTFWFKEPSHAMTFKLTWA